MESPLGGATGNSDRFDCTQCVTCTCNSWRRQSTKC